MCLRKNIIFHGRLVMIKDGIEYPEGIDWERVKIFQKEQLVTAKRVAAI